ncbi:MAG: DUF5317 family protein [bacterium]|nr:DUF5317 family protein [bacterium]
MLLFMTLICLPVILFNLQRVAHIPRIAYVALGALFMFIGLFLGLDWHWTLGRITLPISFAIPIAIWYVAQKPFYALKYGVSLGFFMNGVVIAANGGRMPVRIDTPQAFRHDWWIYEAMTPETRLAWLGDILSHPFIGGGFTSPGDLVIFGSVIIATIHLLVFHDPNDSVPSIKP